METAQFVHLHVHSAYSLSAGAIHCGQLMALAHDCGMPALAITDSNNLFGAFEFSEVGDKVGIQPILGSLLTLGGGRGKGGERPETHSLPPVLLLLAQTEVGWHNLVRLVSGSYLSMKDSDQPSLDLAQLKQHNEGLIALSAGGQGWLNQLLLAGNRAEAGLVAAELAEVFSGRFYIELQRGTAAELRVENDLLDLAYGLDLPIVATNSVYYAKPKGHESHEILLAIAAGATLSQDDRPRSSREHYFKTPAAMVELFSDLPEAIANTVTIARRCSFWLSSKKSIMPRYLSTEFGTEGETLVHIARQGLEKKLAEKIIFSATPEDYAERLDYEISVIVTMGFAGYYLVVYDFIKWAREQDIPVGPGRGSGVGSLAAFCLGITDLDPLRFGLIFERFLNIERVSMPDFDVDFCQDRRDEVIDYVTRTYGSDRVAQIITFGKLQARAVLRDVGRVMAMPYHQVDQICKLVPQNPSKPISLTQALEIEPQLRELRDANPTNRKLLEIGMALEGLYRHVSTHAAGVVIGDRPLAELVPLYCEAPAAMPATQFNKEWVEKAGLVKFDFLGLKTLSVIHRCLRLIAATEDRSIDLERLPLDDQPTFQMLSRGETLGVFQLESSGMTNLARNLRVADFEEIIAVISLFRPGPMDKIPEYIARRHGRQKWDCYDPRLEPAIATTYGIIIYQEQVMQVSMIMAGYSMNQADNLRRAMGKKDAKGMNSERAGFMAGAVARGYSEELSRMIFDQMDAFASYAFNKSHAAAYAITAYHTAWLKCHYPVEFFAASMSYDLSNTDKLNQFRLELERMGYGLLPPDINRSKVHFSVERLSDGTKAVRYGLSAIKNIGEQAMRAVVEECEKKGEFSSISDFVKRIDSRSLNKRQFEQLASAGAFDRLGGVTAQGERVTRAEYYNAADLLMAEAQRATLARQSGQSQIFETEGTDAAGGAAALIQLPALKPESRWTESQELQYEMAALGLYLSAHPLDSFRGKLKQLRAVPCNEAPRHHGMIKIAGVVLERRERVSKRGDRYCFAQISDGRGTVEVTLFSTELTEARELLDSGRPLLLTVRLSEQKEQKEQKPRITVEAVEDLARAAAHLKSVVLIEIDSAQAAAPLQQLLAPQRLERRVGGDSPAEVILQFRDLAAQKEIELLLAGTFSLPPPILRKIKGIVGVVSLADV